MKKYEKPINDSDQNLKRFFSLNLIMKILDLCLKYFPFQTSKGLFNFLKYFPFKLTSRGFI